jgi:hypothetical protein
MPEEQLTCAYRVVRYAPNLVRDEWINIGVMLYEPQRRRLEARMIEEPGDFARLRRLHPQADAALVRGLGEELRARLQSWEGDATGYVDKLDENLSNAVQLSPQRGVLAADFDAELERLYETYVQAPRQRAAAELDMHSRGHILRRARETFRRTGISEKMRPLRAEEFTYHGDPFRIDFAYRQNGTRGFAHAISLERDTATAKVLAFTGERIREKVSDVEFTAITEAEPKEANERHKFLSELLEKQKIKVVSIGRLDAWARDLGARLRSA